MIAYNEASPYHLSCGQKLRVAIAGIMGMEPECIVLYEPTAMLDPEGRRHVLSLVKALNKEKNITILMVTHSVKAASKAGRVLFIKDGEVFHQVYKGAQTDEQFYQNISATLTMLATGGERQ